MITRIVKPGEAGAALKELAEEAGKVMKIIIDFKP